jgi:hypothetical protein
MIARLPNFQAFCLNLSFHKDRKQNAMKKKTALLILVSLLITSTAFLKGKTPLSNTALAKNSQNEKAPLTAAYIERISTPIFPSHITNASRNRKSSAQPYVFSDPAGCSLVSPSSDPREMLANVQKQLSNTFNLDEKRISYIWNGELGSFIETSKDPIVFEFTANEFQPPFTYKADQVVTVFVQNGFAVWLRSYGGTFRIFAVPMNEAVSGTVWENYRNAYWQVDGIPNDDTLVPISKKLPCHWMIDAGMVSNQTVVELFDLNWQVPDYLGAGQQYLATNCLEANRISQEKIGHWDATSMCGPLTWQINADANAFPYRIGSYDADARLFINANPRYWYGRPWNGFDPETYDLVVETEEPSVHYDFQNKGNLYTGDIVFTYATDEQYAPNDGRFAHIFVVAGVDQNGSRLTITNMVKTQAGVSDCNISEVVLYTPGDTETGVLNYEWNNHGYGFTGLYGFDVFRWKWITYHNEGLSRDYTVRWGETLETIGFDWKIAPQQIAEANGFAHNETLMPGQVILLPAP